MNLLLRYQKKLTALLDEGATPDAIRAALLADLDLAPLHAYVREMDDRALEVAAQLRRTWGEPQKLNPP